MFKKLTSIEKRFDELSELLSKPENISNQEKYRKYSKEQSDISDIVEAYREYKKVVKTIEDNEEIIKSGGDKELADMASEENEANAELLEKLEGKLKLLMVPRDPDDEKDIILEIRAGTGGDEAGIFAMDVFNMYQRYSQLKGFKVEILSASQTQVGGFKEVIASITGKHVYKHFRYESGVHRVQRVPKTETQGRIHTSAITVAVLPQVEEKDVKLNAGELKIDIYRSSGPGGQSVNTTDSAVRITHLPTGIMVAMQDEKSQHKNREKGMRVLLSRVQDFYMQQEKDKQDASRKKMVGSGDRSERIRTYNFPQGRCTDHRINLTLYSLESIMLGEIDDLIENLQRHAHAEALTAPAPTAPEGK